MAQIQRDIPVARFPLNGLNRSSDLHFRLAGLEVFSEPISYRRERGAPKSSPCRFDWPAEFLTVGERETWSNAPSACAATRTDTTAATRARLGLRRRVFLGLYRVSEETIEAVVFHWRPGNLLGPCYKTGRSKPFRQNHQYAVTLKSSNQQPPLTISCSSGASPSQAIQCHARKQAHTKSSVHPTVPLPVITKNELGPL